MSYASKDHFFQIENNVFIKNSLVIKRTPFKKTQICPKLWDKGDLESGWILNIVYLI